MARRVATAEDGTIPANKTVPAYTPPAREASDAHGDSAPPAPHPAAAAPSCGGGPARVVVAVRDWLHDNTFVPAAWSGQRGLPAVYALAVLTQVAVIVVSVALERISPALSYPGVLGLLTVALVALRWGAAPALLSTVSGALLLTALALLPHDSFAAALGARANLAPLLIAIAGAAICAVASVTEQSRRSAIILSGKLEAIVEAIPSSVAIFDAEGRAERLDGAAQDIFGSQSTALSPHDSSHAHVMYTMAGAPVPIDELPVARARRGQPVADAPLLVRDARGHDCYLLVSAAPFRGPRGSIDGVVAIAHDVTALHQAEQAAEARTRELQAVLDTIVDGVLVHDRSGRLVQANAAARALLGPEQQSGLWSLPLADRASLYELRDAQGQPFQAQEWPLTRIFHGEVFTGAGAADVIFRAGDGREVEVSVSGAPLRDGEGCIAGAVMVLRDVTERRRLERRAAFLDARLHDEAQQAAAARAADHMKSELLSTVSHELRTPLGAIKGFVSGLLSYGERLTPLEHAEALQMIDEAADRLTELIENLLQAQGLEAGRLHLALTPLNLGLLATTVAAEMQLSTPAHTLFVTTPAGLPPVMADQRRLRQVLQNLIGNAIKYSPQGEPIAITLTANTDYVELRVVDRGIGIAPEHQERIFDRFFRVDNSNTRRIYGTGLGLSIVKGLVEAHGGRVSVESAGVGTGSSFVVALPAARQEESGHGRE